ncbi:MAG: AAA family ATPase, partial [Gammaproteobacteria bacterium]
MLTSLDVSNLVVVREVALEFGPGLTVLTGETGAGKSVLIEALGLALGGRADSELVRQGEDRATVTASFSVAGNAAVIEFLERHELDDGDDLILRRVVRRDGRSRAYLNATPVTLATLRELATLLVDIHAQHAGQRLTRREQQRRLLDDFGGHAEEREAVRHAWAAWKAIDDELAALAAGGADAARIELLSYQVEELAAAGLDGGELDTIEDEY